MSMAMAPRRAMESSVSSTTASSAQQQLAKSFTSSARGSSGAARSKPSIEEESRRRASLIRGWTEEIDLRMGKKHPTGELTERQQLYLARLRAGEGTYKHLDLRFATSVGIVARKRRSPQEPGTMAARPSSAPALDGVIRYPNTFGGAQERFETADKFAAVGIPLEPVMAERVTRRHAPVATMYPEHAHQRIPDRGPVGSSADTLRPAAVSAAVQLKPKTSTFGRAERFQISFVHTGELVPTDLVEHTHPSFRGPSFTIPKAGMRQSNAEDITRGDLIHATPDAATYNPRPLHESTKRYRFPVKYEPPKPSAHAGPGPVTATWEGTLPKSTAPAATMLGRWTTKPVGHGPG